jgi:hypothetical protein
MSQGAGSLTTVTIPSKTHANRVYAVQVGPDGASCQCPGYLYRKACTHITEALEKAPVPEPSIPWGVTQLARVIRWLHAHPTEWSTLCYLAANEGPDPDPTLEEVGISSIMGYIASAKSHYCSECQQLVLRFSDRREQAWPSFDPHVHEAVLSRREQAPAVEEESRAKLVARRPVRFTPL